MGADGHLIVGILDPVARPYVRCRLALPRFGIVARIRLLVDTGADATYLHPRDGVRAGIPFDLLHDSAASLGIGGRSTYFREPAVLSFRDYTVRQRYGYQISVNIAKPGGVGGQLPSLLGRDVIRR